MEKREKKRKRNHSFTAQELYILLNERLKVKNDQRGYFPINAIGKKKHHELN